MLYIKFQDDGLGLAGLITSLSVLGGLSVLFICSKLETEIGQDEIQYRLFPFHWSMRKISKDEIAEVFVRKYSPMFEYGGWGLRWGLNGKAINIRGNMGIQLVLKSGSRILIGTSNAEEAAKALEKFTEHPPAS
ncbi:MAG: hypothetical protein ACKOKB_08855 [Bacteroidota bacterium]